VAKLLIEKGLITEVEFMEKLKEERAGHQAMLSGMNDQVPFRSLTNAVDDFERGLILDALKRTKFVQTKAASLLGITERSLRYKMKRLNIRL